MRRPSSSFRPDIQGLRALAVTLVLAEHAHLALGGGFIGVDVFFVISGFLITGHLVRELDSRGRFDLAGFWARRVRRILPSALLVALVTLGAALVLMPPLVRGQLVEAGVAALLSVPNMYFADEGTDYLAGNAPSPFQHFWSLGVEEQFYLFWPIGLLVLWRLGRRLTTGRRWTLVVLTIAALSVGFFAIGVVLTDRSQPWAFFSLPSRAWELALGGLVAVAVHRGVVLRGVIAVVAGWIGLAGILAVAIAYDSGTAYPGTAVLLPVLSTVLLVWSGVSGHPAGPVRLLGLRPFQYLGGISYALYLWHWPLLVLPQAAIGLATPVPTWARCAALVVAIVLADLTTRFVERPLRRAGRSDLRTVFLGLTSSVTAVGVVLGVNAVVAPGALTTDRAAEPVVPSPRPTSTEFVPRNVQPRLDDATSTSSEFRRAGCHNEQTRDSTVNSCVLGDPAGTTTVAVIGDSHAAHWVPAVEAWAAATTGTRILAYTKNACTMVDVRVRTAGRPYTECDTWRARVLERLAASSPDVVLLAGSAHLDLVDRSNRSGQWSAGLARTLSALPDSSRVAVLADTPEFAESVPRCLSANLDDSDACAVDRNIGVDQAWLAMERRVTRSADRAYVDLTDWFCTATRCGVVSGNTLMYRDHGHLTERWARSLTAPIGDAIRAAR
ncbi:peptidoglycan/LPS O-acetylase OafA/YrhL [Curtobacterium pusillum]|uniref:Peptidoglycan/LPS O-acetylase OafA/YrhL n=1 Tax=Curtobacterium pusillum TaxID=69373 RepID=A0AAW3T3F6_9MICO|nr:acyltransferase family protein [Curtobacterium pusillum]MBA8989721.1 peptidoglycan/LPS O-acetylase OafA/YrhL [Curtobacterium pusillum]